MTRPVDCLVCLVVLSAGSLAIAADATGFAPERVFGPAASVESPIRLVAEYDPVPAPAPPGPMGASPAAPPADSAPPVDPLPADVPAVEGIGTPGAPCVEAPCTADGCDGCPEDRGWLCAFVDRQEPLLADYRNVPLFDDPGCCDDGGWYYSVGGEFRYRYMDERNRLRPQGELRPTNYHLTRFTPFLEVGNEWITGYVQAIDAEITGHDIPITPIDRNRWDLLQYYLDVKVGDFDGAPVRYRYGRQLLLYGDQHLISPLAWANTYRNFEGSKLYFRGDAWDVDAFAVQSVNAAAGAPFRPESFDQKDESRWLSGVYATYKEAPKGTLDLFWIWFNENEPLQDRQDGDRHTLGLRYAGKHAITDCDVALRTWFWDVSGGYQFGRDVFAGRDEDVRAGFASAKGGVTIDEVDWKPTVAGIFWYGSGDDDPTDGVNNTYNSLYPLGHAYWGLIDNFSGQNLIDYAVQGSVTPVERLTFTSTWHWFDKATRNDAIYNVVGAPLGPARTDAYIGNELDLVATWQANPNLQLEVGYLMFWYGAAVEETALDRPDAKQLYIMTTLAF